MCGRLPPGVSVVGGVVDEGAVDATGAVVLVVSTTVVGGVVSGGAVLGGVVSGGAVVGGTSVVGGVNSSS